MQRASGCILALLVLVSNVMGSGNLRVGPVFTAKLPEIQIVIEKPGGLTDFNPVPRPDDLLLVEDGMATVTAASIARFEDTGEGLAIVLAIDVSRSMQGQPLNDIKVALAGFINRVGAQDRVSLVSFADESRIESGFNDSRANLRQAVDRLSARGHETKLNTALYNSLSLFDAPKLPARRRLIVISDGHDEGSFYKQDDVLNEAKNRAIPVDTIGRVQGGARAEEYLEYMDRLARLSGGNYVRANNSNELADIFQQGIDRLHASPVATFQPRRLHGDSQRHTIGVRFIVGDQTIGEDEIQLVLPGVAPQERADNGGPPRSTLPSGRTVVALGGIALILFLILLAARSGSRKNQAAKSLQQASVGESRPTVTPFAGAVSPPSPASPPGTVVPSSEPIPGPPVSEPDTAAGYPQNQPSPPEPMKAGAVTASRLRRKTQIRLEFPPPAPGHPSAVLALEQATTGQSPSPIEQAVFWIGADEGSNLALATDPRVSGFHACIQFHEGSLFLHDNNSTNGTFLNEERLAEGPRPLRPGDRIRVGRTVLVVMPAGAGNTGSNP
jgi:Mg-chelatase subunit ChlD